MRKFTKSILFFTHLIAPLPFLAQPSVDLKKALDQIVHLDFQVDFKKLKGFTVGVIDGDSTYVFSYGVACEGNPAPPTENTRYELGGTTHIFTALLAQRLHDVGELVLDSSVNYYLPDSLKTAFGQAVSLRNLLQYHANLPRRPYDFGLYETSLNNPNATYRMADLLDFWRSYGKTQYKAAYQFSLVGYALMQYIMEQKTGKKYSQLLEEHILRPLDMSNTSVSPTTDLVCGYTSSGISVPGWTFSSFEASEGVKSDMTDMIQLVRLQLHPNKNIELGASANALVAYWKPCKIPKKALVGLGWHQIKIKRNVNILAVSGSTSGHSTFVGLNPKTGTAIIILANSEIGIANMGTRMLGMINQNWKRKQ